VTARAALEWEREKTLVRRQTRAGGRLGVCGWLMLAAAAGPAGCGRLQPVQLVEAPVRVAPQNVVVLFADGLSATVFDEMLAAGELPAIEEYLVGRGVKVERAITVAPSITYAAAVTLATGLGPGRHEITGNGFFDRERLFYADYTRVNTYRDVDREYRAATLYEMLNDKVSVTIQVPVRRGAYRRIDDWASSGIRWFFGQITEIDCLTAERFKMIGEMARAGGRWPELILAYFPATDEMGHRYGPASRQYRASVRNLDEQVGRICRALAASGILERTYVILVSDHGMSPSGRCVDVGALLGERFGLQAANQGPDSGTKYDRRAAYFARFDAVVVNGGRRQATVYLRNGPSWQAQADEGQVRSVAGYLAQQEGVCVAAYVAEGGVAVQNARGRAVIERRAGTDGVGLNERFYRYRVVDGIDPLGYAGASIGAATDGAWHSGAEWLGATAGSEYPDLPVEVSELFRSERAGDVAVFAASGWAFGAGNAAGHGSVTAEDMRAVLVVSGPGIARGGRLPAARLVDVAPTIIEMLAPEKLKGLDLDGGSLLSALRRAGALRERVEQEKE